MLVLLLSSAVLKRFDLKNSKSLSAILILTTRLFALCKPNITLHLKIMERYTALNQTDDELDKSSLDSHTRIGLSRSRSPCLWFASGFFAALTTTLVFALSYAAINKKGTPSGLIPDCKLNPTVHMHGSYDVQFPVLRLLLNLIWNFPT